MTWVAVAIGGASLVGGLMSADAAKSAGNQQANAANNATQAQLQMFNTINDQNAPYRQAGQFALSDILGGLGLGGAADASNEYAGRDPGELKNIMASLQQQKDATKDPLFDREISKVNAALASGASKGSGGIPGGYFTHQFNAGDLNANMAPNYEFMKSQGQGATQNMNAATGGLLSGNTLKAISDYTTNYAGNAYQQAFQNFTSNQQNIFSRLADVAGIGTSANQTSANAGSNAARGMSDTIVGAGTAQAAGTVGRANAMSGGLQNAASWYALPQIMKWGGPQAGAAPGGYPG